MTKEQNFKTKKVSFDCPHCEAFQTVEIKEPKNEIQFGCGYCKKNVALKDLDQDPLEKCPACGNEELHQHKDFNKVIGIILLALGAILIPYTYSISFIVALAIDAILFPFCPWMQVCYNCKAELRGWKKNEKLDRFSHETAANYEYGKKRHPAYTE